MRKCQQIATRIFLFLLAIITSVQTFERITFVEAALEDHNVSDSETRTWEALLSTGFCIIALFVPYLSTFLGLANVARVGALLALVVAISLGIIDTYTSTDEEFIHSVQALALFVGISDGLLATSILATFVNTTPVRNRGWIFGLFFSFIALAFVLGIDHEGVLSSLGFIETTDASNYILVCFISLAMSFTALLLISLIDFRRELLPSQTVREILNSSIGISHRWWRALTLPGVAWGCFNTVCFALIPAFIRVSFVDELEDDEGWSSAMTMNVMFAGILTFLISSPFVGWLSDMAGSLKVMMFGNFVISVPLLIMAFIVEGLGGEAAAVGVVTGLFGFCAAPSVVISLINIQENLEAAYENVEGDVTAVLYIVSWVVGSAIGDLLLTVVPNTFEVMAIECACAEIFLGIMVAVLMTLKILSPPLKDPDDARFDRMLENESKKTNYVIQNDWDVL